MTRADRRPRWRRAGIRVRLGLALALALLPVLILSGLQSALTFQRDADDRRAEFVGAVLRGAAAARGRIEQSQELLRGLSSATTDPQCATRLADVKSRLSGYLNIIRFDAEGRVSCAAAPVPADPSRSAQAWFRRLATGRDVSVALVSPPSFAKGPVVLASVRQSPADRAFTGVMTSVIEPGSLLPERLQPFLPFGAEAALAGADGQLISAPVEHVFPRDLASRLADAGRGGDAIWVAVDPDGGNRLFAAAPVVGHDVYLVLSGRSDGLLSLVRLRPISAFLLPVLAFALALAAVWWVAERGVVRWIVYLRRIAALYARGKYGVRPLRASAAPAEIRDLAGAIGAMAATIGARDAALRESLAAKDDLMREIHHRVKNNLQVISSLLNLQQRSLKNEAAISALHETRQRIVALGLIYRALYEGPDLKRVDFRNFVRELLAQILVDRHGHARDIRIVLNIDPLIIDPDRLAPLALFIVDAISATIERNCNEDERTLTIDFSVRDNEATLTVGASGRPVETDNVALSMMSIFARQLGGAVTHATGPTDGALVRLTFPVHAAGRCLGSA